MNLTPVEALQAEIDHIGDLPEALKKLGWDLEPAGGRNLLALFGRYLAALELAKADAEYVEHFLGTVRQNYEEWDNRQQELGRSIVAAREKLYKALQR